MKTTKVLSVACVVLLLLASIIGCSSSQWERLDLAIDNYPEAISVVGVKGFSSLFVVEMSDRVVLIKYLGSSMERMGSEFPFEELVSTPSDGG